MSSLTPGERETVITFNDEESIARVFSHQRTIITKLKGNPAATLIEEGQYGKTAWATFELPKAFISFRTRTTTRTLSDDERQARADRLKR